MKSILALLPLMAGTAHAQSLELSWGHPETRGLEDVKNTQELKAASGNIQMHFQVKLHQETLNSAKAVADYTWRTLVGAWENPPAPCGYTLLGHIDAYTDEENNYVIWGTGDGSVDTCLGTGGPGYWSYKVVVHFDEDRHSGDITYRWATE